jgi:ATP-binding cassette, subfamily F, member 3
MCMIAEEPNLMLPDEPTNYLDLESLIFLESFLCDFQAAFMVISHDRRFLNQISDHILEVEAPDLIKFPGNLDDYFEQKELLRAQLEKEALKQEAKKKHIMNFVDRFRAQATKARQAQSRLKQLDKMPDVHIKALPVKARIQIPAVRSTGRLIVRLKDVDLGYGAKVVLQGLNLEIERGDRIGVVGPNGAGKSTLLKALSQKLEPLRGSLEWGPGVDAAYFSQHLGDALDMSATVDDEIAKGAHRDVLPQEVRSLAGSLLFKDELDLQKKISVLSGGEKSRVALAQILLKKTPFLVLDEPTNHLDFDTVESLSQALGSFSGTQVVVSHDRDFISRVCSKILEIKDGQVNLYPGSYEEYLWSVTRGSYGSLGTAADLVITDGSALTQGSGAAEAVDESALARKERRKQFRDAEARAKEAEKRYLKFEREVARLSGERAGTAVQELAEAYANLQKAETEWMACIEEVDRLH